MWDKDEKERLFWFRFKIALIFSLLLCIILFYAFPRVGPLHPAQPVPLKITIQVSEIPPTRQKKTGKRPRPAPPRWGIPVVAEEADFPEDLPLPEIGSTHPQSADITGEVAETPARPLLDVYPDISTTSCKGVVRLLLLVNRSGKVENVEVLENTTGSRKCLKLAIEAAKRSRWLPARLRNHPVDSWVTKTYKFNE